jgi:hypothetical protein
LADWWIHFRDLDEGSGREVSNLGHFFNAFDGCEGNVIMWYVDKVAYHFEELFGVVLTFEGQRECFIQQSFSSE